MNEPTTVTGRMLTAFLRGVLPEFTDAANQVAAIEAEARVHAEAELRHARITVAAIVQTVGGRVAVPDTALIEVDAIRLTRYDDPLKHFTIYEVLGAAAMPSGDG